MIRYRFFFITLITAVLIAGTAHVQSATSGDEASFHSKVTSIYSFEPHKLTSAQIEAKSTILDAFWAEAKADPKKYIPLLRNELRNTGNSAFFFYDGSKLLLTISQERSDQALALEAIPRADLQGVQHTDYLRTVHWFAKNGFNTTNAALRILDYPDFRAFIVQHALTLGQDYCLIYMLFPMPDSNFLEPLVARLKFENNLVSQKSILLALWYTMTPEGKSTIEQFFTDSSKSKEAQNYAKQIYERKPPSMSSFPFSTIQQLKEERRKVMDQLSDEALHEFERISARLLAIQ